MCRRHSARSAALTPPSVRVDYEIAEVARRSSRRRAPSSRHDRPSRQACGGRSCPVSISAAATAAAVVAAVAIAAQVKIVNGHEDGRPDAADRAVVSDPSGPGSASEMRDGVRVSLLRGLITSTQDPFAPRQRGHRCDHQNDHQRNADHAKRGTHKQRLRRIAPAEYVWVYVTANVWKQQTLRQRRALPFVTLGRSRGSEHSAAIKRGLARTKRNTSTGESGGSGESGSPVRMNCGCAHTAARGSARLQRVHRYRDSEHEPAIERPL